MTSNALKIIFVRLFLAECYQGVISLFKVTGGTGFIGFHVLVQLLQAGYTVRAYVHSLSSVSLKLKSLTQHGTGQEGKPSPQRARHDVRQTTSLRHSGHLLR